MGTDQEYRRFVERELGRALADEELAEVRSTSELTAAHLSVMKQLSNSQATAYLYYVRAIIPGITMTEVTHLANELPKLRNA